jgi:hypothetical protein
MGRMRNPCFNQYRETTLKEYRQKRPDWQHKNMRFWPKVWEEDSNIYGLLLKANCNDLRHDLCRDTDMGVSTLPKPHE